MRDCNTSRKNRSKSGWKGLRDRDDIREARMGIVGQNTIDFKRRKILEEQRGVAIGIVEEGERASDRGRRWRRRRRRRMRRAVRGKQRVTFLFPFTYDPIFRPESVQLRAKELDLL